MIICITHYLSNLSNEYILELRERATLLLLHFSRYKLAILYRVEMSIRND